MFGARRKIDEFFRLFAIIAAFSASTDSMNIGRIFLISVLLPAIALSCSKFGTSGDASRYEAAWAAAYACPLDVDGYQGVGLILVQGRTDDDLRLNSSGAVASLILGARRHDAGILPEGIYESAGEGGEYLLISGFRGEAERISGSSVAERLPEQSAVKFYAVGRGTVTVERVSSDADGELRIRAELEAGGRSFEFEYCGKVQDLGTDAFSAREVTRSLPGAY